MSNIGYVRGFKQSGGGVIVTDVAPSPSFSVPPFLDNVVLWADPTSIIVSPANKVLRWADKSGLAQDLVQAAPARQPTYIPPKGSPLPGFAGVRTGPAGAGRWLVADPVHDTSGNPIDVNDSSIFILAQPLQDVIGTRTWLGLSAGSQIDAFTFPAASGNTTPVMNYAFPPATQATFNAWRDQPVLYEIIGDRVNQSLYTNALLTGQAAASVAGTTWAKMVLGSTSAPADAFSYPVQVYEIIVYVPPSVGVGPGSAWSDSQRRLTEAYFINKYGAQVVFDGNSQFVGGSNSGQGAALPGYTPHLVKSQWLCYINNGTNGITTPNLTARMAATTAPLFNPLSQKRVIVFLEIENDLVTNGASIDPHNVAYAQTAWANIIAYSRAARAAGVNSLVACSGLPIGPLIPPPANYENQRQIVNGLLRANYSAIDSTTGLPYFDGFADIGGPTSPVGTVASTQNPALYNPADQQHLNDGGSAAAAPLIALAVEAALSKF